MMARVETSQDTPALAAVVLDGMAKSLWNIGDIALVQLCRP
jgi:hypothetical protein